MEKLTSIEYAHILQYIAYKKYGTVLSKTQVLKLLFMIYGLYLAQTDTLLFDDDTPKVWPFGPVFPRVYNSFDSSKSYNVPNSSIAQKYNNSENTIARKIVQIIVREYHNYSATALSEWSHQDNGPWRRTIDKNGDNFKWNDEIPKELIKDYFQEFAGKLNLQDKAS